ncbi:MAG: VWA domain-containing protein [Planctomycetaceae bacterium]|nr:VWA domain-containing protein [Planctomycetaceae bacterium]
MTWSSHILLANGEVPVTSTADDVTTTTTVEFDFPPETIAEGTLIAGFAVAAVLLIAVLWRDTSRVGAVARGWLFLLRMAAFLGVLVIALNPHQRTQQESFKPSQVVLLADTSTSMQQPAGDPSSIASSEPAELRWEAVRRLLAESPLLDKLREQHVVDVATFDSDLITGRLRLSKVARADGAQGSDEGDSPGEVEPSADWDELLQPTGLATRLGDSIDKLLAENRSETLAGIVVLTDGANNVGRDVTTANRRAKREGIPLFAVGVGGTKSPVNLQLTRLIVPSDVHVGDAFEVTALLQSSGVADWLEEQQRSGGLSVLVELLRRDPDTNETSVVDSQDVPLGEDGVPVEVTFSQSPVSPAEVEYSVQVRPPASFLESREDDNLVSRTVNIFDRPTRVLMIAGGPMRDYRFAKNVLYRHQSMEVDVWLQTGSVGISQDADEVLFDFPETREALFAYDVVMAFDIDWSQIPSEHREWLGEWIANEGGGLVTIAGDVFTPQLASADEEFADVLTLYPVVLEPVQPQFERKDRWNQPWPIDFTPEGKAAAFLRIADEAEDSQLAWDQFPGVYRAYSTNGQKSGATVYAYFSDPLSRTDAGAPVLFASQRYGQGITAYVGSPEIWRLRSLDEQYNDRFWINLTRMVSEGRSKRGLQRAMIVLDGRDYGVGQTVPVRARVLTASFESLDQDSVTVDVFDPRGRPLVPSPVLRQDPNRPTEFVGDFRVTTPGKYRIDLPVPDSAETVRGEVTVTLPKLEMESLRQDVSQLQTLVAETGGAYLPIEEAADRLPDLLENRGQTFVLDQQVVELWDRRWVMFFLIGLLSLEWLSRKLMKLA